MIATTTQLNTVGATLATMPGVHALTDVTGFGLLGHTLEMCRGAGLTATLDADNLPVLEHALAFARAVTARVPLNATGPASANRSTLPPRCPTGWCG